MEKNIEKSDLYMVSDRAERDVNYGGRFSFSNPSVMAMLQTLAGREVKQPRFDLGGYYASGMRPVKHVHHKRSQKERRMRRLRRQARMLNAA